MRWSGEELLVRSGIDTLNTLYNARYLIYLMQSTYFGIPRRDGGLLKHSDDKLMIL